MGRHGIARGPQGTRRRQTLAPSSEKTMNAPLACSTAREPGVRSAETLSQFFARALVGLPTEQIPTPVLKRAAFCFEDTLAVALAAAGQGIATAGARVARETGPGPSTIWGFGVDVSAGEAAFANGMMAHGLDFDDTHAAAIMHSSSIVVPTAIALAQSIGATSREMLAASVIGYEVAARLGRLAPGPFQDNGFQATSVLGVFASVAIASRMLGLSPQQSVHAFGIAGSMACGLMEYLADGSDVKQMHPGMAAQSGIRAAELALAGFSGPATVFEGRFGVFRSFARREIAARDAMKLDGTHWEVEDMAPKPYPACLCVHAPVQAMLELSERGVLAAAAPDEIVEIHCYVPQWYVNLVFEPRATKLDVRTPYEARFSAPYCMARALLDGHLDAWSFTPEKLADSSARAIAAKVNYSVEPLPEFPAAFPARVVVRKSDGSTHEAYIRHNLGTPGNPLTTEQYESKFRACTTAVIGDKQTTVLLQAIRGLSSTGAEEGFFGALRDSVVQQANSLTAN